MNIPERGLSGNDATDDELWEHGLVFADVDDVWLGSAKYFPQPERLVPDERGTLRPQPERLMMIGPDGSGRLLTVILELPNSRGYSHVVTGWVSSDSEQSRYDQPGGRARRR